MPPRLNAAALSAVNGAAPLAAPDILGQGRDVFAHRVVDGNAEAFLVHPCHHAAKVHSMIRAALQNIVLPLMNHFMRQRRQDLMILMWSVALQEDGGEFDATPHARIVAHVRRRMSGA